MVERYGAIFGQPEPNSPAADAGIAAGDAITAINGSPLVGSSDFVPIISAMAPGSMIYLRTLRNGELIEVQVTLGSSTCPTEQPGAAPQDSNDPMSRPRDHRVIARSLHSSNRQPNNPLWQPRLRYLAAKDKSIPVEGDPLLSLLWHGAGINGQQSKGVK
jgi:PDZ domain